MARIDLRTFVFLPLRLPALLVLLWGVVAAGPGALQAQSGDQYALLPTDDTGEAVRETVRQRYGDQAQIAEWHVLEPRLRNSSSPENWAEAAGVRSGEIVRITLEDGLRLPRGTSPVLARRDEGKPSSIQGAERLGGGLYLGLSDRKDHPVLVNVSPNYSAIDIQTEGREVIARSDSRTAWTLPAKSPEPRVEARTNGVAYIVDGKGYRTSASRVYAVEILSGSLKWLRKIGGYTRAEVWAVRDEIVVVGHTSGVYGLSPENGTPLWTYEDLQEKPASPTISEGVLLFLDGRPAYAGSGSRSSSTLHALNLRTGEGLWSLTVADRQARPTGDVDYEVQEGGVRVENTSTGRTRRIDLRTGEILQDGGPGACPLNTAADIARSAFGEHAPDEVTPRLKVDLNEDGTRERLFVSGGGPRTGGRFKVVGVTGTAPCTQILSHIMQGTALLERNVRRLDRRREGYHDIEIDGVRLGFDGETYVNAATLKE